MKPKQLSLSEHKRIGSELMQIRETMFQQSMLVERTYGGSHRLTRKVDSALRSIEKLRISLLRQAYWDIGEMNGGEDTFHIYYPKP